MRSVHGTGPFTFILGASFDYDFAIVYARDNTASPSPTQFQQLFDNADKAKVWFDNNTFPSCLEINAGINETKKDEPNKLFVFPNPAQNTLSFQLEKSQVVVSYNIYNMLGDAVITNNIVNTNNIDISELNSGVYFLTIKDRNGKLYNNKFVKR
jgi:ssRNA-specific RNase YbeY (16S rRNA maturation enzyme)